VGGGAKGGGGFWGGGGGFGFSASPFKHGISFSFFPPLVPSFPCEVSFDVCGIRTS